MNNTIYRESLCVNASDTDMFSRLRPSALLKLLQDAGCEHAEELGVGNRTIWSRDLLWVIGRTVLEIDRLPLSDEKVELLTWPGSVRKVFLPRSFELRDERGERLLRAKSIYLLLDRETRHTVTPESRGLPVPTAPEMEELESPASRVLFPELSENFTRSPRYSELDLNGHLNNVHYIDWCEDLLSIDYHRAHALRSLWVEYRKEVSPGAAVELQYGLADDTLFVKGGEFFNAKMEYGAMNR